MFCQCISTLISICELSSSGEIQLLSIHELLSMSNQCQCISISSRISWTLVLLELKLGYIQSNKCGRDDVDDEDEEEEVDVEDDVGCNGVFGCDGMINEIDDSLVGAQHGDTDAYGFFKRNSSNTCEWKYAITSGVRCNWTHSPVQ
ncbi:hypothetical protein BLOT_014883 [Blomia tropicalis]|nr:hypothetical protein BLOT_014883 [Blomia tropicalis]